MTAPLRLVAFAANSRFVGFALVVRGEVALVQARRLQGTTGLDAWARRVARLHAPDLVVVTGDERHRPEAVHRVRDALCDATGAQAAPAITLRAEDIASALGLSRMDGPTLREALVRHHGVAALGPRGRGPRTDRDRHRDMRVLAAAAGLAAIAEVGA